MNDIERMKAEFSEMDRRIDRDRRMMWIGIAVILFGIATTVSVFLYILGVVAGAW